jgi:hypothetical protein
MAKLKDLLMNEYNSLQHVLHHIFDEILQLQFSPQTLKPTPPKDWALLYPYPLLRVQGISS